MSQHWICAKREQPVLRGQPFTRAIIPGRSRKPCVVSGKVAARKRRRKAMGRMEDDCD
jgi:hypothetical protein